MFLVGAQTTADGDMLPGAFVIAPGDVDAEALAREVVYRISEDSFELGISQAGGTLVIVPVHTWQEFADLPVTDEVKMAALAEGITGNFLSSMLNSSQVKNIAALDWVPTPVAKD